MTPLRSPRKKFIPDSVNALRKKNWNIIRMQEHTKGDGLKKALAIKGIIAVFKKGIADGTLTQRRLHGQAKVIDLLITELVDEYIEAKGKRAQDREWNQTYMKFLLAFRKEIPRGLLEEIFRQIREE